MSFEPKEGDIYIFGAMQHHSVWPYRSTDPNDERVSLSFNADIYQQKELEKKKKKQEEMYEK